MTKNTQELTQKRRVLVEDSIKPAGVTDKRILRAFVDIPRHLFVKPEYKNDAYLDIPLPIGKGQTISQPSLVALMTQALELKGKENVLEIGTGSGFQAAILSKLVKKVYTVEIIAQLARNAKKILEKLGIKNVQVEVADGSLGLPKFAPYDAIIVTAAAAAIPKTLIGQLKNNGRLVIPVGKSVADQTLKLVNKKDSIINIKDIGSVAFVPLVGKFQAEKDTLELSKKRPKSKWKYNLAA